MSAQELAQKIISQFREVISGPEEFRGETTLVLNDSEKIQELCSFAKKELGFDYLVDISSVDNYGDDPRWTIVYELYGYGHRQHLRLKTSISEERRELPTITTVWRT
ncbi:MAG TPA: NADH-quinone oxidoreductase subunit C, partial [Verrucomicrobiae bacterium]